jgi:CubicO group peptidase (beta-lactamase class C family)
MRDAVRLLCGAALVCFCAGGTAGAADASAFDGAWNFRIARPGWTPDPATARLTLSGGAKWSGELTFDQVLGARKFKLADLSVKGAAIEFRLDSTEFDLRAKGKLEKGEMAGRVTWKGCGDFDWTAARADEKPVERFEKGLSFDASLPKGEAEKLGMDGAALDMLIRDASGNDTDALVVLRDGKLVAERTFGRAIAPIHTMSVTKFITAIAVAMLLEDGKISSLDAPLSTWFPQWSDARKAKVTLRHLLTHTSGIEHGKVATNLNKAKDRVEYVLGSAVTAEPGTVWEYNNEAVALLSGVIARAAGRQCDDYLKERLFTPLGIRNYTWNRDAAGNTITYAELQLTARDLARIGQLLVDGGRAAAKQILAPASIALFAANATPLSKTQGLLWMIPADGPAHEGACVYHTGWLGQWLVVDVKTKTVGVRLRRGAGGEKPEFEFGGFLTRLADAARAR